MVRGITNKEYIEVSHQFKGVYLYEIWLQRYIVKNAQKYGLKFIKYLTAKGGGGGDLLVLYNDKIEKLEVEWLYTDYNHQNNPKFNDTNILACLAGVYPTKEEKSYLPKHIIYINPKDFNQWYNQTTGKKTEVISYRKQVYIDILKLEAKKITLESSNLKEIEKIEILSLVTDG